MNERACLSLPFPFLSSPPSLSKRCPSALAHQFCTRGCDHSQLPPYDRPCLSLYSFSFFLSIGFFLLASKHACVSFVFKTPRSKYCKYLLPSNCFILYTFMVKFLRSCLCFLTPHPYLLPSLLTENNFWTPLFSTAAQYHLPTLLVPSLNLILFLSKALVQALVAQRRRRHDTHHPLRLVPAFYP